MGLQHCNISFLNNNDYICFNEIVNSWLQRRLDFERQSLRSWTCKITISELHLGVQIRHPESELSNFPLSREWTVFLANRIKIAAHQLQHHCISHYLR